ncbi:unnamed protein product [Rotaria sordida]|uniref:Domain of unknown function with conserved HDNR motif domain-containing protein n=1 Tax=Rotaria sordida TaxID=392033 RepID=A0A818JHG5_9BILA|nr:unnamed protein product [Rotaria sordida]CAF3542844.1 unnamed protein product [Rotaria sordida]
MSQVQIRQISSKSLTNNPQIIGSWFPTGYYGHFRAKSRIDLCNDFRQLARPNPPKKFLDRQNSEASLHKFSQHDNRFKFECDPLVRSTQSGFGRRKLQTNVQGKFDPFFISWIPENVNEKNYINNNKITSYANDFNSNLISSQILFNAPSINSSSSSSNELSVYSTVFNHGQPNEEQSKQIHQETFQRYSATLTRRSQIKQNERSKNVASCLIWNNINNENKSIKTNDTIINNILSTPLEPHINSHDIPTIIKQQKPYQNQLMQTFKTITQPCCKPSTLQDYQANLPFQLATSFGRTRTNSTEHLITKYM